MPPREPDLATLREKWSIPLGKFIDTSELVNRSTLRKKGVDPNSVMMEYDRFYSGAVAYGDPGDFRLLIGTNVFELFEQHPEYAYVFAAHELTHFTQPEIEERAGSTGLVAVSGKSTRVHARDQYEQEAIFWEGQQAAKLGWSREEYNTFVTNLFAAFGRSKSTEWHTKIEMRERPYAAAPALSRREVPVREHLRRRVVEHLKNPPPYCACKRSKTVNRVRLFFIGGLERSNGRVKR